MVCNAPPQKKVGAGYTWKIAVILICPFFQTDSKVVSTLP